MKDVLEAAKITMPREQAAALRDEYLASVRQRGDREEAAILRGYKALARGREVIDLPAVIRAGGVHDDGLPKLAVATSSHHFVYVRRDRDGTVRFVPQRRGELASNRRRDVYPMPVGTLPDAERHSVTEVRIRGWHQHPWDGDFRAMVPLVPPRLRPAHSLDGYTTLFEVDRWEADPAPPVDPALLKHLGGDLYVLLGVWDLTDLERVVLAGRTRA